MLVTAKIKLRLPFLGDMRPDHKGVRRFHKQFGEIKNNAQMWQDQFGIAASELRYQIDKKAIEPPDHFRAPTLHLYNRIYNKVRSEMFESFSAGTVLTVDIRIREDLAKAPTVDQLGTILRFTGDRLGLSPFGSKFGFGRFILNSLEPADNSKYERE